MGYLSDINFHRGGKMNLKNGVLWLMFILVFGFGSLYAGIIQTQESTDNEDIVAELTGLTIKNNIITVKIKIRNNGNESVKLDFHFKDFYIIDEANQKKYYILKDSEAKCIGGPFSSDGSGGRFESWIKPQKIKNIWAKFPLPVDNPESISISIPGFLPFEEIKLT
jgi:hypothetical protein